MSYTVHQDERGAQVTYFFITIPAQLVPYAMLFVSLLTGGPPAFLLDLHGLAAAHLYDFLSRTWPEFGGGRNVIPTPAFMTRLVEAPERIRFVAEPVLLRAGTGGQTSGQSTGVSRGPLPDSWRTRGSGQRLG